MGMNNPYNQYKMAQIGTASQGSLILMLYEAETKNLRKAIAAIEAKKISDAHEALLKAQDIVLELKYGLNMEAGEIATKLQSLYSYIHERLIMANVKKDATIINEVMTLMTGLQEAWEAIIKKKNAGPVTEGINHGV